MSENPELEVDEEQVDLDPDPAPEDGLGEDDFAEFDYTDSYQDVDPNYVPIVDPGDEPDDGDEDLTEEEAEPPEEENELVPYWVSYELQGRNLDEGSAWQSLATEPFTAELEVEVEGLTAGARWEFRLRLVDRNGQRSRWSDPLQISLPTDFTPPPAPTAPDVDENNGYISSWWDGELTGEKPKDFSHIVKYLQQMHPEDDPEGEPGDPYRFSTLGDAGVFSVGFLLSGVLYRTWYTAVDTSGNESPWSDIVEFTPSSAFNTDELEEDLRKLNEERLPELEQSLTTKADEATQAVEAFRTEWDENWDPEAIDELRGRADATEADVATAKAEAEQAKQDAATAQANAEALEGRADATDAEVAAAKADAAQAKRDAEAAQAKADALEEDQNRLEATLAEKASASELNELDGILRGSVDLSDQVANKFYGNMAIVSRLQAEEGWIGGVALGDETVTARHVNMRDFTASQGFIDNAFVNLIQGKMANFDQAIIGGALLKENSVSAKHFVVGDFENLFNDPLFETWGDSDMWWTNPEAREGLSVLTNQPNGPRMNFSSNAPALTSIARAEFYAHGDRGVQAAPGERFYFEYEVRTSGGAEVRVLARFREERMGTIYRTVNGPWSRGSWGAGNAVSFEATAPDEHPQMLSFDIQFRNAGGGSFAQIRNLRVRRALAGKMVVEGLLQATTGELEELFFNNAVGNAISVGIANVIEINADRITSNSWSGQVLTGPVMQSHSANNTGWRIEPSRGLRMWDNSGSLTVQVDGESNYISGRLETSTQTGHRIAIDQRDITFQNTVTGGTETAFNAPHISIRTDGNSAQDAAYILMNEGNLMLVPGRSSGVPRDVFITSHMYAGAGNFEHRVSAGSIGSGAQSSLLPQAGLFLATTSTSQPAGIMVDGPRAFVRGRPPSDHYSVQTTVNMSVGSYTLQPGNRSRGSVTYGAPVPNGTRRTVATGYVTNTSRSNYNTVIIVGNNFSSSGMRWVSRAPSENVNNAGYHVILLGQWR